MTPQELKESVNALIQKGRFDAVPPMLEQAAAAMDVAAKKSLIPFIEQTGLECYFDKRGFFAAGKCYELAAALSATVFGESDERSIRRLRRAANHFAGPDNHLSKAQARQSGKQALVLVQRLRRILEQNHPQDKKAIADAMSLEVFTDDFGDVLSAPEFDRIKTKRGDVYKAVLSAYGEQSSEFANVLIGYAGFLDRHGLEKEGRQFQQRADDIMAALEGGQS